MHVFMDFSFSSRNQDYREIVLYIGMCTNVEVRRRVVPPCPPVGGGTALHSGSVRKNAHTAVDVSFILIILLIDDY